MALPHLPQSSSISLISSDSASIVGREKCIFFFPQHLMLAWMICCIEKWLCDGRILKDTKMQLYSSSGGVNATNARLHETLLLRHCCVPGFVSASVCYGKEKNTLGNHRLNSNFEKRSNYKCVYRHIRETQLRQIEVNQIRIGVQRMKENCRDWFTVFRRVQTSLWNHRQSILKALVSKECDL